MSSMLFGIFTGFIMNQLFKTIFFLVLWDMIFQSKKNIQYRLGCISLKNKKSKSVVH